MGGYDGYETEGLSKEEAAERGMAAIRAEEEARVAAKERAARKDAANQRNSVIAFIVGFVLVFGSIAFGVATGASGGGFWVFIAPGILLIVLGIYYKGKRYN